MNQEDFYRGIAKVVNENAGVEAPTQLANAIYFYLKQHPDRLKVDRAWGRILKSIKILLVEHHSWSMRQVHKFFMVLMDLTKYMKKST